MRCDLHVHSFASYDCLINKETIITTCKRRNIQTLAITDHNEIFGAFKLQKELPLKVIIGEEITAQEGEIIGLFLKRKIIPGLTLEETLKQIKLQEGIVYLPHPFDSSTGGRKGIRLDSVLKYVDKIDIIEVFNSRTFFSQYNQEALEFALKYKKLVAAGSDAHTPGEIGLAGVEIEDFRGKEDFLKKLKQTVVFGKKSPPYVYLMTKWVRLKKKIFI